MSNLRIMKPNSSNDILWNRLGGGRQRPVEGEQLVDSSQVGIFVIFTILFEMLQPIINYKRMAKYNNLSSSQGLKVKTEESHLRSRLQLKSKQRVLGFLIKTLSDDYFVWKKTLIISISCLIFSKRIVLSSYFLCAYFIEDVSNEVEQ